MPKQHLEPTFHDDDLMNFGRYKNLPLREVPVSYLHWWFHNTNPNDRPKLKNYIINNITFLKEEDDDLIWNI